MAHPFGTATIWAESFPVKLCHLECWKKVVNSAAPCGHSVKYWAQGMLLKKRRKKKNKQRLCRKVLNKAFIYLFFFLKAKTNKPQDQAKKGCGVLLHYTRSWLGETKLCNPTVNCWPKHLALTDLVITSGEGSLGPYLWGQCRSYAISSKEGNAVPAVINQLLLFWRKLRSAYKVPIAFFS